MSEVESEPRGELPVVGLGASAGGVAALNEFFSAIPADTGFAFVVVVHLSPDHESHLDQVLSTSTALPVIQVTEQTPLQPDHVYVIPPNKVLVVQDGSLDLTSFTSPRGRRHPIDDFFRTLSESHPDAVGIVLSGTGTDGTAGLKSIKQAGGLVMVQAPEDAAYDGMPRSAIATGLVDVVLPARELAQKLVELRPMLGSLPADRSSDRAPKDEVAAVKGILQVLQRHTGHDFEGYKLPTVMRRLHRRMRIGHAEDLSAYLTILRSDAGEIRALFRDLLISVTAFFRDPEVWLALDQQVIPKLFEGKGHADEVRVWVPGCATGEEAYSVGMLLLDHAAKLDPVTRDAGRPRIQVFASDLDEQALAVAREGVYPDAVAADIPEDRLRRYFDADGDYWRVRKELREILLFTKHDVLRDPPFSRVDLISCRNLLIYLKRDLQAKVFEVLNYALRPGGYLVLGTSESADGFGKLFRPVLPSQHIYQRRGASGGVHLPDLPLATAERVAPLVTTVTGVARRSGSDVELHARAIELYAPPSVLVDESRNILHISKNAGRFLYFTGGSPSYDLTKVIRPELMLDVRLGLDAAFDKGQATTGAPTVVALDGERRMVHVLVSPAFEAGPDRQALVVFAESEVREGALDGAGRVDPRLVEIERELGRTRDSLRTLMEESEATREEMQASNEELQSINEEYKSTLEELETSKEELQSVNEELQTVNAELQTKVDALDRANNDLRNLMASTDVATVFLDRELQIKGFTPQVTRLFNIMQRDRGRPLAHVTHKLLGPDDIVGDAQEVLQRLVPIERQVMAQDGRWYLTRLLPYRTLDDRIDGVVITLVDVTSLHRAEDQLRVSEERLRLLVDGVTEYALFTMDPEGRITMWNAGAQRLFGYEPAEMLGRAHDVMYTPEDRASGAPVADLRAAARSGSAEDERWFVRKDNTRFWGTGVVTALIGEGPSLRGFAKVMRDNTRAREQNRALAETTERLATLNATLEARVNERTAALASTTAQVRQLASDLIITEQRERHRISQVLHDELQQLLYGVQVKLAALQKRVNAGKTEELAPLVQQTYKLVAAAVEATRNLTIDLSPPVLRGEGLTEAVAWLANQMRELHGLEVALRADPRVSPMGQEIRVLLFQVVRELLFNVVKHAKEPSATVTITERGGRLVVQVIDSGVVTDGVDEPEGYGLQNVRERLRILGGNLDVTRSETGGRVATVTVPAGWSIRPEGAA